MGQVHDNTAGRGGVRPQDRRRSPAFAIPNVLRKVLQLVFRPRRRTAIPDHVVREWQELHARLESNPPGLMPVPPALDPTLRLHTEDIPDHGGDDGV